MGGENTEYGADQIQILEGLEAVRKKTGNVALEVRQAGACIILYMKSWIIAVDEALAGFCTEIQVTINPDNSITVVDNGRGIPVGSTIKREFLQLRWYLLSFMQAVNSAAEDIRYQEDFTEFGASVVNALSEWLEVSIFKEGKKNTNRDMKEDTPCIL